MDNNYDDISEMNPAIAHDRIDEIVGEAEIHRLNMQRPYQRHSKGFKLQVQLDHVARDLHYAFAEDGNAQRDEVLYESWVDCLDRILEITGGQFLRSSRLRKRYFAKYRSLSLRVDELVEKLNS